MSKSNLKINLIIEDIISQNRIEFSKKPKEQQDKEKEDIADTINYAISDRDNEERQIILTELSKMIKSSNKSFFDSAGNIDIKELRTTADVTIRNAEKDRLIGTKSKTENTNGDVKGNAKEFILTAVIIDRMINNYENLSFDQRKKLLDNYTTLSRAEQKAIMKASIQLTRQTAQRIAGEDKELGTALSEFATSLDVILTSSSTISYVECIKKDDEFLRANPECKTERDNRILIERYEQWQLLKQNENVEISEILVGTDKTLSPADMLKMLETYKMIVAQSNSDRKEIAKIDEFINSLNGQSSEDLQILEEIRTYFRTIRERIIQEGKNRRKFYSELGQGRDLEEQTMTRYLDSDISLEERCSILGLDENTISEFSSNIQSIQSNEKEVEQAQMAKSSKTIEQIPIALIKYGFEEHEIKEAFYQYSSFFKAQGEDFKEALSEMTAEDFLEMPELLKEEFQELGLDKRVQDILEILAEENFGGNFQQILVDDKLREEFLQKIQAISEISFTQLEEVQTISIQDESFSEFFSRFQEDLEVPTVEERTFKSDSIAGKNSSEVVAEDILVQGDFPSDIGLTNSTEDVSSDSASQGSTSSGRQSFSIDSVKAVSMNAIMSQIQDNIQLVFSLKDGKDEMEETKIQDEEQTV